MSHTTARFTIRFSVGITDRSSGAPYGVTRLNGAHPPRDCGHIHTSRSKANQCARSMARGQSFFADGQAVILHTRTGCLTCGGVGSHYSIEQSLHYSIEQSLGQPIRLGVLGPCLDCDAITLGGEE